MVAEEGPESSHSKNVNGLMSFPIVHSTVCLDVSIVIVWGKKKKVEKKISDDPLLSDLYFMIT